MSSNDLQAKRSLDLANKGYSLEKLKAFRKKIKSVSDEEAQKLGTELLTLISSSDYQRAENIAQPTQLIFDGANLEVRNKKYGDTGILVCAKKNLYDTFSLLVRSGSNINAQSDPADKSKVYGSTATIWSARKGHLEILKDLLLLQADINIACTDGDTALHSAVKHNQIESTKLLIEAGVVLNARNNLGEDALSIAQSKKYDELIKVITSYLSKEPNLFPVCTEETILEELNLAKEKLDKLKVIR